MRIVHVLVIAMLVFAAAHVYRIKMESTVRTERVAKLQSDIRKERDAIAALRAEWARLQSPMRVQGLVERHLKMQPLQTAQFDDLKSLPERPPRYASEPDPIGAMIEGIDRDIEANAPEGAR